MRVLFVGGGTLGSVTPLLAVAEELQKKTSGVFFWGTRRGPERALVEAAGIPFRSIPAGKLRRYWDLRNLLDLVVVKWAFWVAFIRFLRWRPSVVMGAGSFVQVPVMWAAWLLRIPIIIHQLDVRPSLANRLVAPFATRITVTFPESAKAFRHAEVVGAPVRRVILAARDLDPHEAKRYFGFSGDRPTLLILGGGTGAQALNELVWGSLSKLTSVADVMHVVGKGKSKADWKKHSNATNLDSNATNANGSPVFGAFGSHSEHSNVPYRSFELLTDNLPSAYAAADLVISRAGMGTIAELAALGKATVLVPMPGTHQEANAAALEAAGAAVVWDQRELTSGEFARQALAFLRDAERRKALTVRATAVLPSNVTRALVASILAACADFRYS